jgi:hypothetical protein
MSVRTYNCKNEEVPVIGRYLLYIFKRDFADFAAYIPVIFTNEYIIDFEQKINDVNNLVNPQAETVELKNTTTHMYSVMDSLIGPADIVSLYIKFSKGAIPISARDFGLTPLKHKIRSRDAEGVLKNLRIVVDNLEKYGAQLAEQKLDENIIRRFTDALPAIETDNQHQFEIVSKRKTIVENNINIINNLYGIIVEICKIGKMMYKGENDLKVRDYTFAELRKNVRNK